MPPIPKADKPLTEARKVSTVPGVVLQEVSRELGGNLAVDRVSFAAHYGSITGILGPNGAGKTTLLRVLAGLLHPSSGEVTIAGYKAPQQLREIYRQVGFLTGTMRLYNRLTVRENLEYFGKIRGMTGGAIEERIALLAGQLGMQNILQKYFTNLSNGERQKTLIANTLLHDPQVLILDEITVALDVLSSEMLLKFVRQERERGKCILFSTHIMSEAEYLCDQIMLLHQGKCMDFGSAPELIRKYHATNLTEAFLACVHGRFPGQGEAA